jgi:hypothetical protein
MDKIILEDRTDPDTMTSPPAVRQWGALASFVLAVVFIVPSLVYLVGDLRSAIGPLAYSLADFLYGPAWVAALLIAVFTLREQLAEYAPRRMSLAFVAAALAAGAMVAVACIRAANRHYHLIHPELHLESSQTVLIVWTTLVAGLTGAGFHFLGWALALIGSVGWTSERLPRLLSALYLAAGAAALFVYVRPDMEGTAIMLGVVVSIWQGIWLWRVGSEEMETPVLAQT